MHARFRKLSQVACLIAWAGAVGLVSLRAETHLVAKSPFGASGAAAGAASGPPAAYELAGSMAIGNDVSVCIYETRTKRSQWIPVGGAGDGVRVLSFDAARDTVMVSIPGGNKELTLRKPTVTGPRNQGPSMAQIPVEPPAQPPVAVATDFSAPKPESPAAAMKEQREARMLVSDLLEIGMQQRKAYQDAKAKAAGAPQPPPPDN